MPKRLILASNASFARSLLLIAALIGIYSRAEALQLEDNDSRCIDICSPINIYLAKPIYTVECELTALYLLPCSNHLDFGVEAIPLPTPSPQWKIHSIRPDYHWAFDLGLELVCPGRSSSFSIDWEHFYSKDSASTDVGSSNMIGPFFEIGPDALPYKKAHGKAVFHFDSVALDYGVLVQFGSCFQAQLMAGVSGAYIKQELHTRYSDLEGTIIRTIKVPSSFIGAGPQIGLDMDYSIGCSFHFTGHAGAALLVGSQKNHTRFEAISPALEVVNVTPPNVQNTSVRHRTQVVPAFKGKIGLAYSSIVCDSWVMSFELGYQAEIYINAIQSVDIGSEVVTPPVAPDTIGVYARTFDRRLSNFALAGPYLTLDIAF